MPARTNIVPVQLPDGTSVHVMATMLGGEQDVAAVSEAFSFEAVATAIEGIASALAGTLQKVKPSKASVEFGIEVAVEAGKLTTLLVSGSATGSLKVTLEWESRAASHPRLKRRLT